MASSAPSKKSLKDIRKTLNAILDETTVANVKHMFGSTKLDPESIFELCPDLSDSDKRFINFVYSLGDGNKILTNTINVGLIKKCEFDLELFENYMCNDTVNNPMIIDSNGYILDQPPLLTKKAISDWISTRKKDQPHTTKILEYCQTHKSDIVGVPGAETSYPKKDFWELDNNAGGNCLFLSVGAILQLEDDLEKGKTLKDPNIHVNCLDIRGKIIKWMSDNRKKNYINTVATFDIGAPNDYKWTPSHNDIKDPSRFIGKFDEYLKFMGKYNTYSGIPEIVAISNRYNRNIIILGLPKDWHKNKEHYYTSFKSIINNEGDFASCALLSW